MMDSFLAFQFNDFSIMSTPDSQSSDFCEEFLQNDKKCYRCTFGGCGKIFKYKSEITKHSVVHFNNRPFSCPYEGCDKAFKRSDALENHIRIHTKQSPFVCDFPECGLKFTTKAGLRYHTLKHTDNKTFRCSYEGCERNFLTLAQLKKHEKSLNYHQKMSMFEFKKDTEEEEFSKPDNQKFLPPQFEVQQAPRLVSDMNWEVKNPMEVEELSSDEETPKDFEKMLEKIFNENKELKKKLSIYEKLVEAYNENQALRTKLGNVMIPESPKQEYFEPFSPGPFGKEDTFVNDGELDLLEFLREQQQNDHF